MTSQRIGINDQGKTSRGRFAVDDAKVLAPSGGGRKIAFSFADRPSKHEEIGLEDLAGCLRASHDLTPEEICGRIEQFAQKSGPLFGQAKDENVADWQLAINVAQEAIGLQELINKKRQWVPGHEPVIKTAVSDGEGAPLFTCYSFSFAVAGAKAGSYSRSLPKDPLVKQFKEKQSYDYLFAKYSDSEEFKGFDIFVISCKAVMSPDLLVQALCFLNDTELTPEELVAMGADRLAGVNLDELIKSASEYSLDDSVTFKELPAGMPDAPHVQHIVQALANLHLRKVTIDLFKKDNTDDSLSFDTLLSYLWYGFANKLGEISIGYCRECGAGFSLTGHRGPARLYCSDKCRTKAKNKREKGKVDRARELYLDGKSIDEIVKEVHGGKLGRAVRKDVIDQLSRWPQLKHAIKAECKEPGEHVLARRCLDDGIIDEKQLLMYEGKGGRPRGR